MKRLLSTLIAGALVAPALAFASGLQVMPTRLEVNAGSIASLTVSNGSDSPISVQARAVKWQQTEPTGRDDMKAEASDLIWYPKIFTVPPGGQQVVRIGSKTPVGETERAYRLFIREVPVAPEGEAVNMFAIRMSIPVFLAPNEENEPVAPSILAIKPDGNQLVAEVKNDNNRFVMMHPLEVHGINADGSDAFSRDARGWYVLSGVTREFDLGISAAECQSLAQLRLVARSKAGDSETSFAVDSAWCASLESDSVDATEALAEAGSASE
ncbi:MAG: fimbrial chaperone protein [Candidatus Azotimanducaceae bacterium]|jgi:fimbrial chaperone protein